MKTEEAVEQLLEVEELEVMICYRMIGGGAQLFPKRAAALPNSATGRGPLCMGIPVCICPPNLPRSRASTAFDSVAQDIFTTTFLSATCYVMRLVLAM